MISNDNKTDNLKNDHIINYEDLEKEVIEAIEKKTISNLFENKKPKECMYMQKVAEFYLSWFGIILTLSTFFVAFGATYIITYAVLKIWPNVVIGGILVIIGCLLFYCGHKLTKFQNYHRIIFEAEQRILDNHKEDQVRGEMNATVKKIRISRRLRIPKR